MVVKGAADVAAPNRDVDEVVVAEAADPNREVLVVGVGDVADPNRPGAGAVEVTDPNSPPVVGVAEAVVVVVVADLNIQKLISLMF